MKTLYLVRHAKTIQGGIKLKDFDRYLKPRGYKDSKIMAEFMVKNKIKPDLVITSPAKRALQTTEIFCDILEYSMKDAIDDEAIYYGGTTEMIALLQKISNQFSNIILFGHNPTIHETVNYFIQQPVHHFPTCCIAGIRFEIDDWMMLNSRIGKLVLYEKPKDHR